MTTAYLYFIGSLSGFLLAADAWRLNSPTAAVSFAAAGLGLAVGSVMFTVGRRWPPWVTTIAAVGSGAIIAAGTAGAPTSVIALAATSIGSLISIYAMIFYPWRVAWIRVALITIVQLGGLWIFEPSPLLLSGIAVLWLGQAGVVGVLVRVAASASIDSLTGLANRRGWDDRITDVLEWSTQRGEPVSVALADVDFFKRVNDEQGHAAGDILLREIAMAWQEIEIPGVMVARRGGDEFAILMPGSDLDAARELVETFRAASPTAVSAGVAQHRPGESASALLRRTDTALYQAKAAGRDQTVASHQPDDVLVDALAKAIAKGEINVVLQPIFLLQTHQIRGFEVLARWTHPSRGPISPSVFIPIAETSGLIGQLDEMVLRTGLALGPRLQQHYRRPIALSVNASGRELLDPGFADRLLAILDDAKWPTEQLCIEVTESLLDGSSPPALAALNQLRERGIRIAIDDFGTGWSSFSRLDALPVDHLKLDRTFITQLPTLPRRRAIVQALLTMCADLGIDVIAEGIETEEQCELLRDLGCPQGQGHHFGTPASADQFIA